MTYEEFNEFCDSLPATTHVVQWGGSDVWKVCGKVFAIGGWDDREDAFTFKASAIAYEFLKDEPGLRPAPYLASRGMKWIQHYASPGLPDDELKGYTERVPSPRFPRSFEENAKSARSESGLAASAVPPTTASADARIRRCRFSGWKPGGDERREPQSLRIVALVSSGGIGSESSDGYPGPSLE